MHVKRRLAVPLFAAAAVAGFLSPSQAALTKRYANTATLLPDGNILVLGGQTDDTPTPVTAVNSAVLVNEQTGVTVDANAGGISPMPTVVSSHTATLLPNGEVLVAGGMTGGLATNKIQIYDPVQNCWRPAALAMTSPRFNHTATLLQDGRVLICGGLDNGFSASKTCDIFTPTMPNPLDNCAANGGSLTGTVTMLIPRENHSATLLADGRVFLTGGHEPNPGVAGRSLTAYLTTSEVYTPGNTFTTSAAPLTVQRAFHRASLLGSGKVLIVGGSNDTNLVANRGFLDSVEIYDPIADRMSPGAQMLSRVSQQGQVTRGDGSVLIFGGLGNVTTTYFNPSGAPATAVTNQSMTNSLGAGSINISDMRSTITSGTLSVPLTANLSEPVSGTITDGFILMSTPSITFPGGVAYLTPGAEDPVTGALTGTYALLTNYPVGANATGFGGLIPGSGNLLVTMPSTNGYFVSLPAATGAGALTGTTGSQLDWTPHNVCTDPSCTAGTAQVCGMATGGCGVATHFSGPALITGLPASFASDALATRHLLKSTFTLTSGNIDIKQGGSVIYSIALNSAQVAFGPSPQISLDPVSKTGSISGNITLTNVAGIVTAATPVAQDPTGPGYAANGLNIKGMAGPISFAADGVSLTDPTVQFKVDVATIVIRKMVMADATVYTPLTNTWSFLAQSKYGNGDVFGQTATLEPTASVRQFGGRDDTMAVYAQDVSLIEKLAKFTAVGPAMTSARANQTSTLLPNGKILVAGGSNGPNVVGTSDLFDPKTRTVRATGSMSIPRDLHTATLLANGRVLAAGGFVTTSQSTGPTPTAEIYYPNVEAWVRTGDMLQAADNHSATLLPDGNVLVAGGFANGTYLDYAEVYVTTAARWFKIPAMPERRALHTATLLQDGRVLLAGGVNETGVLCTTMIFDASKLGSPTNNPWYPGPQIRDVPNEPSCTHIHSHAASALKDGRVLLTGGTNGVAETNSAYIYTPSAAPGIGSFQNSTYLGNAVNRARFGHTSITTPNGKVMIMGGATAFGTALPTVETYDAAISSFQIVGDMTKGRFNHSATIGADGFVYVFGGNNGSTPDSSIEANYFTGVPDSSSLGAPAGTRQPTLSQLDHTPISGTGGAPNPLFSVGGANLQGFGESAGGGAAAGNSSFNGPRLIMQAASSGGGTASQGGGEFLLDLSTRIYFAPGQTSWNTARSTFTLNLPTGSPAHYVDGVGPAYPGLTGGIVPYGWYHMRDGVNAVFSNSLMVQVAPALPVDVSTAVQVADIGQTSVTWAWGNGFGPQTADGWEVFSSSTGVFAAQTPFNVRTFSQTGLSPNTTAAIVVAAFTGAGDGTLAYSSTYYTYASSPTFLDTANLTTFTAVGYNSVTLNWGQGIPVNSPGTFYEVSQSRDNFATDFSTPVPLISQLTSSSTVIPFLQPNTQYWFRVRAYNGNLVPSPFSITVTTKTVAPVTSVTGSPPTSPSYPPTTTIQWGWVDPGGVSYFKVYNATVPFGQPGSLIGTVATPPFLDVNLATNTPRVVMVSAVTLAGEGPLSPAATAYTQAATPGLVVPAIVNLTTGSFTAFWTANGNPLNTSYQMLVLDANSVPISSVTTNNFNGSFSFGASSVAAAQFSVKVTAVNGAGVAAPFVVLGTTFTLPDNPSALTITGTTPQSVSLSWSGGANSSSGTYEVQFTTAVDFTNVGAIQKAVPFSANYTKTFITVSSLQTSTTYQFRVQARNPAPVYSAFTIPTVTTSPFNGGVPLGSLGGFVSHTQSTVLAGSLGGGRTVSLLIPANAFSADTFVTISTFDASGAGNQCPGGVNIGIAIVPNPYIQPLHPVFLTVGYTPAELGATPTSQAALERVDPSGTCVPLSTTLDTANNKLTAQLNHFSLYQVANVAPSSSPDATVIFPNPFYPSQGNGFVTFKNMPANSRIRIFTARGELVYEGQANGSGLFTWGGINRYGRTAASGVYLAVVEANGAKNILKLVVLR